MTPTAGRRRRGSEPRSVGPSRAIAELPIRGPPRVAPSLYRAAERTGKDRRGLALGQELSHPALVSPSLALAVIGHVNHGKTALVRALTGMETDRLVEERARGLSITLGFAWRGYACGDIDFIDAPGHEDFIRAMVQGATGVRAALLTVSAVEGVARQTREHLLIAGLLGLTAGLVAVTKADLLAHGDEGAALARIAADLDGTFLSGQPIVLTSSQNGRGVDELHRELEALAARSPPAPPLAGAFLPIDRAFSLAGAGTIITGTLQGGPLATDSEAVLLPSGRGVHIRQVQIHGQDVAIAEPGRRVAVNVRGVGAAEVASGEVLCAQGAFIASRSVDALVTVAPEAARPLRHTDEVRVFWGARQDMAKVAHIGAKAIPPGGRGMVQLRFPNLVIAHAGQRGVLRRPSPAETLGGLVVLDPCAPTGRGNAERRLALLDAVAAGHLAGIAERLAERDGGVLSLTEAARLARLDVAQVTSELSSAFESLDSARLVSRAAVDLAETAYLDALAERHRQAPLRAHVAVGALRHALARRASRDLIGHVERRLAARQAIRLAEDRVAWMGHDPYAALSVGALERLQEIEGALKDGGLSPPDPATFPDRRPEDLELIQLLVDSGRAASLRNVSLRQTLIFHTAALESAAETLRRVFPPPATFTTGEARAALATSRKFIVPVLEHLDALSRTRREGDVRRVVV